MVILFNNSFKEILLSNLKIKIKRFIFKLINKIIFQQYEYKQQNAKKKKVTIEISVDGVRICLKKRKRRMRVVSCCNAHESSLMIKLFSSFYFFTEKITELVEGRGRNRDYASSNLSYFLCVSRQLRSQNFQLHSTRRQLGSL